MTEIDDYPELDARIKQLGQKTRKLLEDIKNYDTLNSGSKGLNDLFRIREQLAEESDDIMNEIEVEDFLLHGSRMNKQ
jgi:hypothetical protein